MTTKPASRWSRLDRCLGEISFFIIGDLMPLLWLVVIIAAIAA